MKGIGEVARTPMHKVSQNKAPKKRRHVKPLSGKGLRRRASIKIVFGAAPIQRRKHHYQQISPCRYPPLNAASRTDHCRPSGSDLSMNKREVSAANSPAFPPNLARHGNCAQRWKSRMPVSTTSTGRLPAGAVKIRRVSLTGAVATRQVLQRLVTKNC